MMPGRRLLRSSDDGGEQQHHPRPGPALCRAVSKPALLGSPHEGFIRSRQIAGPQRASVALHDP